MASRYGFDEAKIARFRKEGRGQGAGPDYKPWLTVADVPSRGRAQRMPGFLTKRIHHLLSDLERNAFLIFDSSEGVTDIREQFPMDADETLAIAEDAGIRHPVDATSRVPLVQTTDFLLDLYRDGGGVTVARAVKPASELGKPRVVEKLEIERRYWTSRGVDWGIVTERELPPVLLANLELLRSSRDIDQLMQPHEGYFQARMHILDAELDRTPCATLRELVQDMDARLGMEAGSTLLLVHHLLATKAWRTDLMRPITDALPISAIRREPAVSAGRASG
ncbi:TnsA endonuclease N-terminal domain-containing protein [Poseidonocella sp. HB161398]|uniref:TnsA endonuclease N-terminal domain-containing protein n=1 Tax=Poseidonocella sp. HB161398 TaxID=2320855 RepID=UPI0011087169|nr:TnsA endonuclease N-terminal domain-containing protein [Poseidonocella sp. HB161398]